MPNRRRSWPYEGQAASPPAITVSPDGTWNSARRFVGPLRAATEPRVGPRGAPNAETIDTDVGVDRISPRTWDPMGTSDARTAVFPPSELIARVARRRRR